MNDKDDSGSVSVEEAMQILYLRFGKGLLDSVRTHLWTWGELVFLFRESVDSLLGSYSLKIA